MERQIRNRLAVNQFIGSYQASNKMATQSLLFQFLAFVVVSTTLANCCPDGWVRMGESCYHITEERMTWENAREVIYNFCFFLKKWKLPTAQLQTNSSIVDCWEPTLQRWRKSLSRFVRQ